MIITASDLELYQHCPARWKLRKEFPPAKKPLSPYIQALKSTLIHMYSHPLCYKQPMKKKAVRSFWDEHWWVPGMNSSKDKKQIFQTAAKGWLVLNRFYDEFYTKGSLVPVSLNTSFEWRCNEIVYSILLDIVLTNAKGQIIYLQIGTGKTDWQIYTSLATKMEVAGLASILDNPPIIRYYLGIGTKSSSYRMKTLKITESYIKNASEIMRATAFSIERDAIYASWSDNCRTCACRGKCWF